MIDQRHTLQERISQLECALRDEEHQRTRLLEEVGRVAIEERTEESSPFYGESGRCYAQGWNEAMAYVRSKL